MHSSIDPRGVAYRPLAVFAVASDDATPLPAAGPSNPVPAGCDQAKIADVDNAPSIMEAANMTAILLIDNSYSLYPTFDSPPQRYITSHAHERYRSTAG